MDEEKRKKRVMGLREKVRALQKKQKPAPEPDDDELPPAILALIAIKAKHGDEKGIEDEMECPICQKGIIHYSIAGNNGHVWARCSTDGCVRFVQ
jgi:hypothetical protein